MQGFKDYVIQEYKDKVQGYAAVQFRFTHNVSAKVDKKSETPLRIDIINVKIKFVDKDLNKMFSTTVNFENNLIPKNKQKSFINISPKELENKFAAAKTEIVKVIHDDYIEKVKDISTKVGNLQRYSGNPNTIIPTEFKGESIVPTSITQQEECNKISFDM